MHRLKEAKSSYHVQRLDSGRVRISCQGRKCRGAIHFCAGYDEFDQVIFERVPQGIIDQFNLERTEGSFLRPDNQELLQAVENLNRIFQETESLVYPIRKKRIRKESVKAEPKHIITYAHIRKLYYNIGLTMTDIAEHFRMSRVTIRKILNEYKKRNINVSTLDQTVIKRSKSFRKYENEDEIVSYIRTLSERKDFQGVVSTRMMIDILRAHFGESYSFKRSKVAQIMKKAGLAFKRVKVDIVKDRANASLNNEQKTHLLKLVYALSSEKLLVFLDETYVSRQLVPKRIWVNQKSDARIRVTPKDDRITIVAACSPHGLEAFQVIYDSIDAVHYCVFVLTVKERLQIKYPNTELVFIHDNARPHVGKVASEVLADYPFIRQSAYSPRMNLIEYYFGLFKKNYRILNFTSSHDIAQEQLIKAAIMQVKRTTFMIAWRQFLGYCLKTFKNENLIN